MYVQNMCCMFYSTSTYPALEGMCDVFKNVTIRNVLEV